MEQAQEAQNITEVSEAKANDVVEAVTPEPSSPVEAMKEKAKGLTDDGAAAPDATVTPDAVPEVPAYQPNFKYKVLGEERELDERVRSLIKDKESEDWIKSVFSKADGIQNIQAQRDQYRSQYQSLESEAKKVLEAVDRGDYRAALQALDVNTQNIEQVMSGLGFSKEDVIKYAYGLAQLTPEQEQAYAKQRELELQTRQQNSQVDALNQRLHQADVQLKTFELKSVLSTPEVAPLVETFDIHHGKGAFWDQVCQRGEYWHLKGVDKTTQDLVNEVLSFARTIPQVPNQPAPPATPATQAQKDKLPVIPNVNSGGGSPAKKKIKSLEELRSYAKELED